MSSKKKVVWAPAAIADLKSAHEYVCQDSPSHAALLVGEIIDCVGKLASFERPGRAIPEIGQSRYREIISGEYRIMHEVREGEILIFRVLHSKRLFFKF